MTVTVSGVNDTPVATNDTAATDEDTPTTGNVLTNDSDIDTGDELTVVDVNKVGTLGNLTVDPNSGAFTYDPNGQFEGLGVGESDTETFEYTIEDKSGSQDTAILTVTVTGVNDVPVAAGDAVNTDEESTVTIDVLANDIDADDNDDLSVGAFDATSVGGATVTRNGDALVYDPRGEFDYLADGAQTTDTFGYTVEDGHPGGSDTAAVTVSISGINDAPTVEGQVLTVNPDDPDGVVVGAVAVDDPDVGDTHKFVITASDPPHGTALFEINEDTGVITAPDTDALVDGTSFDLTVEVTDMGGAGVTDTATVTINVVANQPPEAKPDEFTTDEESIVSGNVLDDNGNGEDSDPESDAFSVITTGTDLPGDKGGLYSLDAAGNMTYDPNGQFEYLGVGDSDTDTFDYTIEDSFGGTGSATVTVTITGVNDAPTAVSDTDSTDEDTSATINVLVNDTDPDTNDTKNVQSVNTTGTQGAVTNNGTDITYNPNGAFEHLQIGESAVDTFSYTMVDGQGVPSTATVTVTITGVNDPPTAVGDTDNTNEDTPITIDVLVNDTDPDTNDTKTVQSVNTTGTQGAVTNNGTDITYNPNGAFEHLQVGESAVDTFAYTMVDSQGIPSTTTVTVTVTGINDAPVLTPAGPSDSTDEDTPLIYNLTDFINNGEGTTTITDPDSSDTVGGIAIVGAVGNGTLAYSLDGTSFTDVVSPLAEDSALLLPFDAQIRYTPDGLNNETATLTFRAWDATSGSSGQTSVDTTVNGDTTAFSSATDTATTEVTDVNDAPELIGQGIPDVVVLKDGDAQPAPINLLDYFSDPDGDVLSFDIDDPGNDINSGLISVDLIGNTLTITYASYAANQDRAPSTIVVTATDPGIESVTSTFTVTVTPVQTVEAKLVVLRIPTSLEQAEGMTSLPASASQITVGENYVVELWMQDLLTVNVTTGPVTGGLSSAGRLDINYDAALSQSPTGGLHHEGLFTLLASGAANNADGVIEGFGGAVMIQIPPISDVGVVPYFARVGYVEFSADNPGVQDYWLDLDSEIDRDIATKTLSPSRFSTGDFVAGSIHKSQVNLASISVTHVAGSPLNGTEGRNASEDTAVYVTLVEEPTTVDADGQVVALPESQAWIDEWDSYWVELWVNTIEGPGVTGGTVDLAYNSEYFTATEIDHGSIFVDGTSGSIDDALGLVTNIGGTTTRTNAGGAGYSLLGRVKFESLSDDQVPVDTSNLFMGPYDLGLGLSDSQLEVADVGLVNPTLGEAPDTELWAVPYDVDDSDQIDFGDFTFLATSFAQDVVDSDSPYVWAMDFDKSGTLDFGDFTFFAVNFAREKGSDLDIQFPSSFTQRWIGSFGALDEAMSVDELVDAASETWQNALGLAEPINVQLVVRDLGDAQLGEAQILAVNDEGRPTVGRVILDDDANGLGWYSSLNQPVATGKYDLYTVLLHEIGHTLGFTPAYDGFASQIQTDADGKAFVFLNFTARLDDTGQHLDPQANLNDLMNPELEPGVRKLPSVTDVQILQASYEAARVGAVGFSTEVAALRVAAEPAALASEALTQENLPVQQSRTDFYSALGSDLGLLRGSLQGSSRISGTFANDTEDELKTTEPSSDSALIELLQDVRAQRGTRLDSDIWHELADEQEFGDLLDELEATLAFEFDGVETLDAVFAEWE